MVCHVWNYHHYIECKILIGYHFCEDGGVFTIIHHLLPMSIIRVFTDKRFYGVVMDGITYNVVLGMYNDWSSVYRGFWFVVASHDSINRVVVCSRHSRQLIKGDILSGRMLDNVFHTPIHTCKVCKPVHIGKGGYFIWGCKWLHCLYECTYVWVLFTSAHGNCILKSTHIWWLVGCR